MESRWDCIVVGGGAAGLSAALVLGRARKRILVVDAGEQSNRSAHGIGGLLGHNGRSPDDFYAAGRGELAEHPSVEFRAGEVERAQADGDGFALELAGGALEQARRLLLATGMDYRYADLPGAAERWGRSVFHCPFCHGWEVRDRALCVLDRGSSGARRALLLRGWSDDVTLLTDGPAELDATEAEQLQRAGITVDERGVSGLQGPGEELQAVELSGGERHPCDALLVAVTMHQRSPLPRQLGVAIADEGPVAVDAIEVDSTFSTSVEGVYAAGDASSVMPSVANAVAGGSTAAAHIVHSLI